MTKSEDRAVQSLGNMLGFAKRQGVGLAAVMKMLTNDEIELCNRFATDRRIRDNLSRPVNTPKRPQHAAKKGRK